MFRMVRFLFVYFYGKGFVSRPIPMESTSEIGGGGFILFYLLHSKALWAYFSAQIGTRGVLSHLTFLGAYLLSLNEGSAIDRIGQQVRIF